MRPCESYMSRTAVWVIQDLLRRARSVAPLLQMERPRRLQFTCHGVKVRR